MALVLVNGTNEQRGIQFDETGIVISSFSVRYFPQFKAKLPNKDGQNFMFAIPDAPSREVTVQGETNGNTGVMAFTFSVAATLLNAITTFGGSGGMYMDEVTETQGRDAWRSINMRLSSDPLTT